MTANTRNPLDRIELSSLHSNTDRVPKRGAGSWEQIVSSLADVRATPCASAACLGRIGGKCPHKDGPSWVPAVFCDGARRASENVESVTLLVIDIDHATEAQLAERLALLAGVRHVVHGSHSDAHESTRTTVVDEQGRPKIIGGRCVRVVVPLTRPLSPTDWLRFWIASARALGADESTKDASRLYYLPSRPADASHPAIDGTGYHFVESDPELPPLDVDAMLANAPLVATPNEARAATFEAPDAVVDYPCPEADALQAVEKLAAIWPTSGRHDAFLVLCGVLARAGWQPDLIADFTASVRKTQALARGEHTTDPQACADGEWSKRYQQAVSSVAAGAGATGLPTLIKTLTYHNPANEQTLGDVLDLLRVPRVKPQPEFAAAMAAAASVPRPTPKPPATPVADRTLSTRDDVLAAVKSLAGKRGRIDPKKDGGEGAAIAALMKRLIKGDLLSESLDERDGQLIKLMQALGRDLPNLSGDMFLHLAIPSVPWVDPPTLAATYESQRAAAQAQLASERSLDAGGVPTDETLRRRLPVDAAGAVKSTPDSIETILRHADDVRGRFRFNELAKTVEVAGGCFECEAPDDLPQAVQVWLSRSWLVTAGREDISSQFLRIARRWGSYDPVTEYLDSLTWDGVPRLDRWLQTYCNVEDSSDGYISMVGGRWLIGAVARAYDPGCKMDTVLVFEGAQGLKKSTAFGVLADRRGWFSDTPLVIGDKDSLMTAACTWIVEMQELSSLTNSEVEAQKAFITAPTDKFRVPYGKTVQSSPRRCVFAATTNDREYLKDRTGNRRWWPVPVPGRIRVFRLIADRDQIWAEAVARYQGGKECAACATERGQEREARCAQHRWWLDPEEQLIANRWTEDRMSEDPWVSIILAWYSSTRQRTQLGQAIGTAPKNARVTLAEVAEHALGIKPADIKNKEKSVGAAMRSAGFVKVRVRDSAERGWRWVLGSDAAAEAEAEGGKVIEVDFSKTQEPGL